MKTKRLTRTARQRGATLTEYAMIVAVMMSGSLAILSSLEDNSGSFLTATGSAIGEPRVGREHLEGVVFTTPDGWTPPTQASSTSTTESTTTTTESTTTTTEPTTTTTTEPTTTTTEATTTTTEATTTTTAPAGDFDAQVVGVAAGGCIRVSSSNGWIYRSNSCSGSSNQITGEAQPNGNIVLKAPGGKCFRPWNNDEDVWVDSFSCNGSSSEEWVAIPVGNSFMYQNVATGYCLDLTRSSTDYATQNVCDADDQGQLLNL